MSKELPNEIAAKSKRKKEQEYRRYKLSKAALQGILAQRPVYASDEYDIVKTAVRIADALLRELDK